MVDIDNKKNDNDNEIELLTRMKKLKHDTQKLEMCKIMNFVQEDCKSKTLGCSWRSICLQFPEYFRSRGIAALGTRNFVKNEVKISEISLTTLSTSPTLAKVHTNQQPMSVAEIDAESQMLLREMEKIEQSSSVRRKEHKKNMSSIGIFLQGLTLKSNISASTSLSTSLPTPPTTTSSSSSSVSTPSSTTSFSATSSTTKDQTEEWLITLTERGKTRLAKWKLKQTRTNRTKINIHIDDVLHSQESCQSWFVSWFTNRFNHTNYFDSKHDALLVTPETVYTIIDILKQTSVVRESGCWHFNSAAKAPYRTIMNHKGDYHRSLLGQGEFSPVIENYLFTHQMSIEQSNFVSKYSKSTTLPTTLIEHDAHDNKSLDKSIDKPVDKLVVRHHPFICELYHGKNHQKCLRPSHLCWGTQAQNANDRSMRIHYQQIHPLHTIPISSSMSSSTSSTSSTSLLSTTSISPIYPSLFTSNSTMNETRSSTNLSTSTLSIASTVSTSIIGSGSINDPLIVRSFAWLSSLFT
jgi:hypothetical protein